MSKVFQFFFSNQRRRIYSQFFAGIITSGIGFIVKRRNNGHLPYICAHKTFFGYINSEVLAETGAGARFNLSDIWQLLAVFSAVYIDFDDVGSLWYKY